MEKIMGASMTHSNADPAISCARKNSGFSLLELSIALVIIAAISGGVIAMMMNYLNNKVQGDITVRMDTLEKALLDYRRAKGRLPCPADITLAPTVANDGVEASTIGDCYTTGAIVANFSSGSVVAGGVPYKTLRLPQDYAVDTYGRKIMYVVDNTYTAANAFSTYGITATGAITMKYSADVSVKTNFAASANGGVASASSATANYAASGAIDGDRRGLNLGADGVWSPSGALPQWLQVDFSGSKTINTIDVIGIQTNGTTNYPTQSITNTSYVPRVFQVQYWTGATWTAVTGGNVTVANTNVWRRFTFSDLTTTKIRLYVTVSNDGLYISELEAWGDADSPTMPVYALVSFGENGHGAYPGEGGATRISADSVNAAEQENCDCTSAAASGTFNKIFYNRPYYANPANSRDTYDDVVRFKERKDLPGWDE